MPTIKCRAATIIHSTLLTGYKRRFKRGIITLYYIISELPLYKVVVTTHIYNYIVVIVFELLLSIRARRSQRMAHYTPPIWLLASTFFALHLLFS